MKAVQRRDRRLAETPPGLRPQRDRLPSAGQRDEAVALDRATRRIAGGGAVAKESIEVDTAARPIQRPRQRSGGIRSIQRAQFRPALRRPALALRRAQIHQHAAADGASGRGIADDEAVADRGGDRRVEHDLDEVGLARPDRLVAQDDEARGQVRRAVMESHRHPLADRPGLRSQHPQPRIDAAGRRMQRRIEHDVAAGDRLLRDVRARQRQRAPFAGLAMLGRPILHMQRAHARFESRGTDDHRIANRHAARQDGPGHHRSRADQGK
ncbi:MAG TPA: hypothetical protein VGQ35_08130 [Dongiaceae bacterium]|nr:hypothetical protein [Dongiaceae bacterium]